MKPIISLLSIILFVILALASFGPDESTNTSVAISDCMQKPTIDGQLQIKVTVSAFDGTPVGFSQGSLFIVHQKVLPDETCTYDVLTSITIPFYTDKDGLFNYEGTYWSHNNSEDLFRVELVLNDLEFGYLREVLVHKYNITEFDFDVLILPPL